MKSIVHVAGLVFRYIAWLAIFAGGLWIIQMIRTNVFDILAYLRVNPWAFPAIINFFTVAVFVAWLAIVIWLESFLTEPPEMSTFWQRLLRVVTPLGALALVSFLLQVIL